MKSTLHPFEANPTPQRVAPELAEYVIRGDSGSVNREPAADSSRGKYWSPLLQYYGPRAEND